MFRTECIVTFVLLGLMALAPIAAQAEWYIAPAGMYTDADDDRGVDDSAEGGQLSIGWVLSERWALEAMAARSRLSGANTLETTEGSLNLLFSPWGDALFSPYVIGGLGQLHTNPEPGENVNSLLANAGVGVKLRFGNSPVSLRLEHRLRAETANTPEFNDQITSLGLQFAFGRKSEPVPIPAAVETDGDGDSDGVPDSRDACPDSPAGQTVDSRGCALDSDGDSVIDDVDQCPNTVRGAAVDAAGCELDSDNDGVVDRLDDCPDTREGARVDIRGCEIREIIDLPGVNFETNSDRLLPGAEATLDDAAATLRKNLDLVVEVAGHTDSTGDADYNASLSERRARTVRDYLVNAGVNPANLTVKGYGEEQPVADNSTAVGQASNRRVELRILNRDQ